MSGNKHDNGVHEVGKPETRKAYQEDTPGQQVEKYLESINEVIEEKKEKQKKSFMKVFQNPLKGFPYNEELDDNLVNSIKEGYGKLKASHYDIKITVRDKDVDDVKEFIANSIQTSRGEIEDVDTDRVDGGGQAFKGRDDIFVQGDGAGQLGLDMVKKFRSKIKVMGESVEIKEGKYAKYSDLLMKKAKEMQAIDKAQNKSGVASPSLNALKSINKEIEKEMKKLGITESINDDLEEGKMGELFLDIQNGATAKDIARDYPVSIQQAKDFLKDYYSQKKRPMKMGEETEILRNYDSLLEAKDLMPDIKKIVDTKSATKVGGVMLDMFTASMILTVYDKVNDQNKGRMEKSNIQTLVHIAHKVMGVKESLAEIKLREVDGITEVISDEPDAEHDQVPTPTPTELDEETVSEAMKIKDIFRKHKRELTKAYKTGDLSFSSSAGKKAEDDLMQWAMSHGEVNTDDPDDFFDWLSRDLEDIVKGKIKEDVSEEQTISEGTWAVPDSYPKLVALQKFLRTPHKAKTAKDVEKFTNDVYSFFGDDSFFDDLGAYGTTLPGGEKDEDGKPHSAEYMKRAEKYNKIKKGTDLNLVLIKQLGDWTGNVLKFKGVEMVEFPREWYLNDNPKHKKDDSPVKAKLESVEEGKGMKRGSGNLRFKRQGSIKAEGKMDGGKLTGQEISVYFRRNKVKDKQTRKAVEIALDHGGAMSYAIKQIEKLKRGLSKDKDVQKALNYANFGESVRVNEVGFMFKEDSPIAGNMQVEGDPYIPQKKGVNKNIANYWNKEIKGLKPKELEAIQSMYMITDHSGVVQMYKAGKRDFIKSIKS